MLAGWPEGTTSTSPIVQAPQTVFCASINLEIKIHLGKTLKLQREQLGVPAGPFREPIADAALEAAYVSPVQPAFEGELFLRELLLAPGLPKISAHP